MINSLLEQLALLNEEDVSSEFFTCFCIFYYVDLKEMINLTISADKKARGMNFSSSFF